MQRSPWRHGSHVFALVAAVVLLGLTGVYAWSAVDGARAKTWPIVQGTVQRAEIFHIESTRSTDWLLDVTVGYEWQGDQHQTTQTVYTAYERSKAEVRLVDWPAGKLVDVYCNPSAHNDAGPGAQLSPRDAQLDPGRDSFAALVGGAVQLLVALFLFWIYWRGAKLASRATMNADAANEGA